MIHLNHSTLHLVNPTVKRDFLKSLENLEKTRKMRFFMKYKIQKYLKEIKNTLDKSEGKDNKTYVDIMNSYEKYVKELNDKIKKRKKEVNKKISRLNIELTKELILIKDTLMGNENRKIKELKKEIEKYQEEASVEHIINFMIDLTGEYIKYEFIRKEKLNYDFTGFEGRPPVVTEWGQTICTNETCLKRVKLILRDFTDPVSKVLFIGDDDLNSLVLSGLSRINLYVLDIDENLLKFIRSKTPGINTFRVDITKEIPENLMENFDAIALNPYWNFEWINKFLNLAVKCIRKNKKSRIYLTFPPCFLTEKENINLQKNILKNNLIFKEIIPGSDYYDMAGEYVYQDIINIINILKNINRELKDSLLEKLIKVPATSAYMYILAPSGIKNLMDKNF